MSNYSYYGKGVVDKFAERNEDLPKKIRESIGYPIFGLNNRAKSYNCFLNSVLQAF